MLLPSFSRYLETKSLRESLSFAGALRMCVNKSVLYIELRYISKTEIKHYIKTHDTVLYRRVTDEQHNTTTQKPKRRLSVPHTSLRNLP